MSETPKLKPKVAAIDLNGVGHHRLSGIGLFGVGCTIRSQVEKGLISGCCCLLVPAVHSCRLHQFDIFIKLPATSRPPLPPAFITSGAWIIEAPDTRRANRRKPY